MRPASGIISGGGAPSSSEHDGQTTSLGLVSTAHGPGSTIVQTRRPRASTAVHDAIHRLNPVGRTCSGPTWRRLDGAFGRLILEEIFGKPRPAGDRDALLSAEERYRRFMDQALICAVGAPEGHRFVLLGMTPETFSRLRARVR